MFYSQSGVLHEIFCPDVLLDEVFEFYGRTRSGTNDETDVRLNEICGYGNIGHIESDAVAILEPCKVRVITKGSAVAYHESRRLQTVMTQAMKSCDVSHFFPALQGNLTDERLDEFFQTRLNFNDKYVFCSGDYKGATDTLRRDLSSYCVKNIMNRFSSLRSDPRISKVLEMCLVDHVIHYKYEGMEKFSVTQRRGQLMGSFLSFPILNIINLAVNLAFMERNDQLPSDWRLAPLFVNGDDVLMALKYEDDEDIELLEDKWTGFVKTYAGFQKSVGKNYFSPTFCTVNSQIFAVKKDLPLVNSLDKARLVMLQGPIEGPEGTHHFRQIKCPRIEACWNDVWSTQVSLDSKRETRDLSDSDHWRVGPQTVGHIVTPFIESCPEETKEYALRSFIRTWSEKLKNTKRPWFLPADLGGLGLPCLTDMFDMWKNDAILTAFILRLASTNNYFDTRNELKLLKNHIDVRPIDRTCQQYENAYHEMKGYHRVITVDDNLPSKLKSPYQPWMFIHAPEDSVPCMDTEKVLRNDSALIAKLRSQAMSSGLNPIDMVGMKYRVAWSLD